MSDNHGKAIENLKAFECPYCETLNENYISWKGRDFIECQDCKRVFYCKMERRMVFKSFKNFNAEKHK